MKNLKSLVILTVLLAFNQVWAQKKKQFKVQTIAFYNVENLFDTINDPLKDDEKSPIMEMQGNRAKVYEDKIAKLARVISDIGYDVSKTTPAILGVAEIENKKVLEDLINHPKLKDSDYGIIHFDSPDKRGIDVGLIYKQDIFQPHSFSKHPLYIYNGDKRVYTRDQLLVSGVLDGEEIHIIVNHWPSRSGGEARSRPKRVKAAELNKRIIDSLQNVDKHAKIFTMGDLNDDPFNASMKEVLKTKDKRENVKGKDLFNPMEAMAKSGNGTLAYRDGWNLFDQIVFTAPLLKKDYSEYRYYKAGIYNKTYLSNKRGRYKGYPFRSFSSGSYTGGYSDHFPVYVHLIKEVK
ncbi:endonuclease/exonuclease/phosphatase family protein [uncultured Kordia sp.]|uniref:endonuclease/exonuclease/phosphatase family protein n=1 Tax=uncultured Kordia sp. TaxID=507699 RepID=UPI002619B453|nr:endonuclease/exonuclease/phosphatase family protein [uncultured Kordia sp.]